MKKRKLLRLLLDLRTIWHKQTFTVARVRQTWSLVFRFVTGKVFLLTVLVTAAVAAPAYDLLNTPPAQVSNGPPAPDVQILVVSIDPSTCPPCARLEPIVDRLKSQGYNLMVVGPHPSTRRYPTIFIFKDKTLSDTIVGYVSEKTLKARIRHAQSTP